MAITIDLALRGKALLGESPVWSVKEQAMYWVDIHRPSVLRTDFSTGQTTEWPMPTNVGSIGLRDGGLVAAMRTGFVLLDLNGKIVKTLAEPIAGTKDLRFNDGRVDRRGRFWAGTVQEKRVPGLAALYRLDADGHAREMQSGFTVANGSSWSPDGKIMYFADSWVRKIYAYDFDVDAGSIANRRVFAEFGENEGIPDGAAVDTDGCYWIAHFDGGRVTRYTPRGKIDRVIEMPVIRPTSCCFGGPDLRTLYITSASFNLSEDQLRAFPLSGSIFVLDPGAQGLPEPLFDASQLMDI
jgi:sugar lactone lactonase YvrE